MNVPVLLTGVLTALSLIIFVLLILIYYFGNKIPGRTLLVYFLAAELIYIFGYTCGLLSNVVSQKIFFNHFQYIGLAFIAPLWYLISIRLANVESKWTKLKHLVFVVPAIALTGNFTHMSNHYFYKSFIPSNDNTGLFVLLFEKGFLYYVNSIAQCAVAALAAAHYYSAYKRSAGCFRRRSAVLMGLSAFGFFMAAGSLFSRYTDNFDYGAVFAGVSAMILLLALFGCEVFQPLPLAYVRAFEFSDNPIIILDDNEAIVKCNAAAVKVFGEALQKGRKISEAFPDEPELLGALSSNQGGIVKRTVNGMQMYFSPKLIRLDAKNGETVDEYGYLLTFFNETVHANAVQTPESAACFDPLTGVYNRKFFFEKANQVLENAKSGAAVFSFIMLDVDKLKHINDSFGHLSGDSVLKRVCGIMQERLCHTDIAARYGGEEFIVLLPDTEFDRAMKTAAEICGSIREEQLAFGEEGVEATVSIGVFTPKFPLSGSETLEDFVAAAGHCLYQAKKDGGNRIFGKNGNANA